VANVGALRRRSCNLVVALMDVEVAILLDDLVEIVVGIVGMVGGLGTFLDGGAPLLLGWLILIVIRGSVGRRKTVDTLMLGSSGRSKN
jgi:hypothetical protein